MKRSTPSALSQGTETEGLWWSHVWGGSISSILNREKHSLCFGGGLTNMWLRTFKETWSYIAKTSLSMQRSSTHLGECSILRAGWLMLPPQRLEMTGFSGHHTARRLACSRVLARDPTYLRTEGGLHEKGLTEQSCEHSDLIIFSSGIWRHAKNMFWCHFVL